MTLTDENRRLRYVLEGVAGAIDTGRNEPLVIWREQIRIALEDCRAAPAADDLRGLVHDAEFLITEIVNGNLPRRECEDWLDRRRAALRDAQERD